MPRNSIDPLILNPGFGCRNAYSTSQIAAKMHAIEMWGKAKEGIMIIIGREA